MRQTEMWGTADSPEPCRSGGAARSLTGTRTTACALIAGSAPAAHLAAQSENNVARLRALLGAREIRDGKMRDYWRGGERFGLDRQGHRGNLREMQPDANIGKGATRPQRFRSQRRANEF